MIDRPSLRGGPTERAQRIPRRCGCTTEWHVSSKHAALIEAKRCSTNYHGASSAAAAQTRGPLLCSITNVMSAVLNVLGQDNLRAGTTCWAAISVCRRRIAAGAVWDVGSEQPPQGLLFS